MANAQDKESRIVKVISGLNSRNKKLQDRYIEQEENFDQERKGWDRSRKKWSKKLGEVVTENQNLQFENANKTIALANFKSEIDIKSKEIIILRSMEKILESRLTSAQNDAVSTQEEILKKESEIASLKSELTNLKNELVLKISELDYQKSEAISKPVIGGDDEKNTQSEEQSSITKPDDISAINEESVIRGYASSSKNLSKYFVRGKSMDQAEKIDGEITELPKNDTEINPKVSDSRSENASASETSISENSEDIIF